MITFFNAVFVFLILHIALVQVTEAVQPCGGLMGLDVEIVCNEGDEDLPADCKEVRCSKGCILDTAAEPVCPDLYVKKKKGVCQANTGHHWECHLEAAVSRRRFNGFCQRSAMLRRFVIPTTRDAVARYIEQAEANNLARALDYGDRQRVHSARSYAGETFSAVPEPAVYHSYAGAESVQSEGSMQNVMMAIGVMLLLVLVCMMVAGFVGTGCYFFGKKTKADSLAQNRYKVVSLSEVGVDERA